MWSKWIDFCTLILKKWLLNLNLLINLIGDLKTERKCAKINHTYFWHLKTLRTAKKVLGVFPNNFRTEFLILDHCDKAWQGHFLGSWIYDSFRKSSHLFVFPGLDVTSKASIHEINNYTYCASPYFYKTSVSRYCFANQ